MVYHYSTMIVPSSGAQLVLRNGMASGSSNDIGRKFFSNMTALASHWLNCTNLHRIECQKIRRLQSQENKFSPVIQVWLE